MRFSTFAITALLACAPTALADSLFQPTGAVLSNVDSVAQLSPQVVLDYLIKCASVTATMNALPDDADCLIDNFIRLEFPGDEFGDYCSPPDFGLAEISLKLEAANNLCSEDFSANIGTATLLFYQVFEAESCWTSLCNQEDEALLHVESHFMEECSGVDLPYPLESVDGIMSVIDNEARDDAILTCMLDYIMDTPAQVFGFDEPPVPCYPPAYDENMQVTCPNVLAKSAYDHCTANSVYFEMLREDQMFMTMSMSMSMSMAVDEDDDDLKMDNEEMLQTRFCNILDSITTEKGLECLTMICEHSASSMPSSSPSLSSGMPSDTPSLRPSSAPSRMPSASPSAAPSLSPSSAPSSLPSRMPSSAPSMAPSSAPSSAPTLIVSNPEEVQSSSATAVSIGVACLVLLVAALFAL